MDTVSHSTHSTAHTAQHNSDRSVDRGGQLVLVRDRHTVQRGVLERVQLHAQTGSQRRFGRRERRAHGPLSDRCCVVPCVLYCVCCVKLYPFHSLFNPSHWPPPPSPSLLSFQTPLQPPPSERARAGGPRCSSNPWSISAWSVSFSSGALVGCFAERSSRSLIHSLTCGGGGERSRA